MTTSSPASKTTRRPRRRRNDGCLNFLTLVTVIVILLLGGYFLLVYLNPTSPFNPFPPPSLPAVLVIETPTAIPEAILPTATSGTTEIVATQTPVEATAVLAPTHTPIPVIETPTVFYSNYPFALQSLPVSFPSAVFHPESGCDWMGVAGQVFDLSGRPVIGLVVRLGGSLAGKPIDITTLTGSASQWYGESGYEFVLGNEPTDATGSLWVQLYDQGNIPISERIKFDTFSDCQRNLVLINFKQAK